MSGGKRGLDGLAPESQRASGGRRMQFFENGRNGGRRFGFFRFFHSIRKRLQRTRRRTLGTEEERRRPEGVGNAETRMSGRNDHIQLSVGRKRNRSRKLDASQCTCGGVWLTTSGAVVIRRRLFRFSLGRHFRWGHFRFGHFHVDGLHVTGSFVQELVMRLVLFLLFRLADAGAAVGNLRVTRRFRRPVRRMQHSGENGSRLTQRRLLPVLGVAHFHVGVLLELGTGRKRRMHRMNSKRQFGRCHGQVVVFRSVLGLDHHRK